MGIKERITKLEQINGNVPKRHLIIYEPITQLNPREPRAPSDEEVAAYEKTIVWTRPIHFTNWNGERFGDSEGGIR